MENNEKKEKFLQFIKRQKDIAEALKKAKETNKLSHAYLIKADKNLEAVDLIKYLAMLFYCEENSVCLSCDECHKILTECHINLKIIRPEGNSIKKEQIQSLQEEFTKTSLVSGKRLYLINKAEKMSTSAANSLLKFLEEPVSSETYGILITENIDLILPTIISRAQILSLRKANQKEIQSDLEKNGLAADKAFFISRLTNDIGAANNLLNDENKQKIISLTAEFLDMLNKNTGIEPFQFYRDLSSYLFIDKEYFRFFIELLLFYFIDIYKSKNGYENITFIIEKEKIMEASCRLEKEVIIEKINYLMEISSYLDYNINESLCLDQLIIKLRG